MSPALPSLPYSPHVLNRGKPNLLRRALLLGMATLPVPLAAQAVSLAQAARAGGVLLIRHARTEPGIGDPPEFRLGQCSTQRNLSDAGRTQARDIGHWFQRHGLQPTAVLSSHWCRCQDTARLAFDRVEDWAPLNSTFAGQGDPDAQVRALRARLQTLPAGSLEVWVTHQVIMTALTGAYPDLGEGFLLDAQGRLVARGLMPRQGDPR